MEYDLGFATEKVAEMLVTRRAMPLPKTFLGVKNAMGASRFSTIQSLSTYGKFGKFSKPMSTFMTGGRTIDIATYYNRNFIIPIGRVIGFGQFQHIKNNE